MVFWTTGLPSVENKVPFILSLHVLLALWYSLGTVQQHNLEYLGVLFMVRAIQPWLV